MATKTDSVRRKSAKTKPDMLNVAFVLDMSGSMARIRDATAEGMGQYISDLQKEEWELIRQHGDSTYTRFSLTAFDTVFEHWIVGKPILEVKVDRVLARYQPRGWTALYDAIADTITQLETAGLKNDRFLVIVMTDGLENSSVEYSLQTDGRRRLFDLIKAYEARGNWTFVYLGANVDAYEEASAIGIPTGNAAYYSASRGSVAMTTSALSGTTSGLRTNSASATTDFFEGENDYRDSEDKNLKERKLWTPGDT